MGMLTYFNQSINLLKAKKDPKVAYITTCSLYFYYFSLQIVKIPAVRTKKKHKKFSYHSRTAQRAMSVEILSTATQLYKEISFEKACSR